MSRRQPARTTASKSPTFFRRHILAALSTGPCLLAACSRQDGQSEGASVSAGGGAAAGRPPIAIGAVVSTTGAGGTAGQYQAQAYQLWEAQVNARGGLLGRPVKLVLYDDGSDPVAAARQYQQLIDQDKVDLVLGPYANSATQAASTVTEKAHYPMLAAGGNASDIWKRNYRYLFGVFPPVERYFDGVIDLAVQQGYRTLALLAENTIFPQQTAAAAAAYAKAKGLQLVYQEKYPTGAGDLSAPLRKIKELGPDVLLGASYQPDSILITRQAKELGLSPRLLAFSVGAQAEDFEQALGADAAYVCAPSIWEPPLGTPGSQEFVEAFQKRWGREPDFHAATGYAAAQILEAAVKQARTVDRDRLRDTLAALETATILPGRYKVDESGLQIGGFTIVLQWQGGKKAIIWPESLASGKAKLPMPDWNAR